jgi:hypothetical protein
MNRSFQVMIYETPRGWEYHVQGELIRTVLVKSEAELAKQASYALEDYFARYPLQ